MTHLHRISVVALVALTAIFSLGTPSYAGLELHLSDTTGANLSVLDRFPGGSADFNDGSNIEGRIFFEDNFGAFTGAPVGLTVTTSSNASLTVDPAQIRQTTITLRNSSTEAQTLTIRATDNTFTVPGAGNAIAHQSISFDEVGFNPGDFGLLGGMALFEVESFVNGTSIGIVSLTSPGSAVGSGPVTLTNPYTLDQEIRITLGGGGEINLTGTTEVTAIPEPATLAAALTALPVLGGLYLRRRTQHKA